jgi:hypothetical protein
MDHETMNTNENANNSSGSSARKKIRYAVVGLGYIAEVAVLPAFAHAKGQFGIGGVGLRRSRQTESAP